MRAGERTDAHGRWEGILSSCVGWDDQRRYKHNERERKMGTPARQRAVEEPERRVSLPYPALVGILGGGQLARMTAEAAARLGIEVAILEREAASPAGRMAAREVVGAWTDQARLAELAEGALA